MNVIVQATNVELDILDRRALETECRRLLAVYAKDVDLVTIYVSNDEKNVPASRIAAVAVDGKRYSGESHCSSHLLATAEAAKQVGASLQREQTRKADPRMMRAERGAPAKIPPGGGRGGRSIR